MNDAHAERWRLPLVLMLVCLVGTAVQRPSVAGTTSTGTSGADYTSATVTGTTSTNSTTQTASTTESNSTSPPPHATDLAILYYSIPELVVLAFFAVGIYLILVRDRRPRQTRR